MKEEKRRKQNEKRRKQKWKRRQKTEERRKEGNGWNFGILTQRPFMGSPAKLQHRIPRRIFFVQKILFIATQNVNKRFLFPEEEKREKDGTFVDRRHWSRCDLPDSSQHRILRIIFVCFCVQQNGVNVNPSEVESNGTMVPVSGSRYMDAGKVYFTADTTVLVLLDILQVFFCRKIR